MRLWGVRCTKKVFLCNFSRVSLDLIKAEKIVLNFKAVRLLLFLILHIGGGKSRVFRVPLFKHLLFESQEVVLSSRWGGAERVLHV